jgi:hypothetical protein
VSTRAGRSDRADPDDGLAAVDRRAGADHRAPEVESEQPRHSRPSEAAMPRPASSSRTAGASLRRARLQPHRRAAGQRVGAGEGEDIGL